MNSSSYASAPLTIQVEINWRKAWELQYLKVYDKFDVLRNT